LTKRFSGENFVCPEFSSKNQDATDFSLYDIYKAYQMILSLEFPVTLSIADRIFSLIMILRDHP